MSDFVVTVNLWEKEVGKLAWSNDLGTTVFEYNKDFINSDLAIAPFILPKSQFIHEFSSLDVDVYKRLPPTFADSLPDDFGNRLINGWLKSNSIKLSDLFPHERLCFVGKRGIGALEYIPEQGFTQLRDSIDLSEMVGIANKVFASKSGIEYNSIDKESLSQILQIGTSAGGARPKILLAHDPVSNIYKPGDITYDSPHSYWLLKLDGVSNNNLGDPQGFGRIEYAYHRMAKDCGIQMSECKLIQENNRAHFITRRFDRDEKGMKLHKQTVNGLAGLDYNKPGKYRYEDIFTICRLLKLPHNEVEQLYRRMVFNVVARNQDDHTKNFAFLMNPEGKWSIAPAYDICYSYKEDSFWVNKHNLSINGKVDNFELKDLIKVGKENNITSSKNIIQEITDVVSNWSHYSKESGVDKDFSNEIKKNLRLNLSNSNEKNFGLSM